VSTYAFSRKPISVPRVLTAHRKISTPIPAPGSEDILSTLDKYESRSMHGQLPLVWKSASGHTINDHAGNRWIDFTSMIFVANIGHGNGHLISRVQQAVTLPILGCYAYPNQIRAEYLRKLVGFAGPDFEKAFLLSAGTEATEAAFKLMKMHGQNSGKVKNVVLAISGNWHGRTLGAQSLSDNKNQKAWIEQERSDIVHIEFPYPWILQGSSAKTFLDESLRRLEALGISMQADVSGVMLETFQGWAAVFYPIDYVRELRDLCDRYGILLCFDEMQSGFGRTGRRFGYEHYGVRADLLCVGKGMGGGFPISGVIGSTAIMDLPEIGNMSSTHSGNPVMCAAGLAVLEEIEAKNLVSESERKGKILHKELDKLKARFDKVIGGVYGKGLVASVIIQHPEDGTPNPTLASSIAEKCMQKGLLVVHTGRESIKIGPPLTISDDALLEGIAVLGEAIGEQLQ